MNTFTVDGQPYTMAQYLQMFQPRPVSFEAAVARYPYPEERQGMIDRHHLRTADKFAGKNIEMTGGQHEQND